MMSKWQVATMERRERKRKRSGQRESKKGRKRGKEKSAENQFRTRGCVVKC